MKFTKAQVKILPAFIAIDIALHHHFLPIIPAETSFHFVAAIFLTRQFIETEPPFFNGGNNPSNQKAVDC